MELHYNVAVRKCIHSCIFVYLFNNFLFTVCQALCRTLANKGQNSVLFFLTISPRQMFSCTTLIRRCIIFFTFLKSECALVPMMCSRLVGIINFLEICKIMMHLVVDVLYFIGDVCPILLLVPCFDTIMATFGVHTYGKPLILGTEVGPGMPELRCPDVQIRRKVSQKIDREPVVNAT